MKINVKRLHPDAMLPTFAHEGDAGADLYALEDFTLGRFKFGELTGISNRKLVRTGIAIEIPYGYVGLVHPRSGLSKFGISIVNTPGTIDAGYRGEIGVHLISHDDTVFNGKKGDRIAQLLIQKIELPEYEEVEELSDSVRGNGGWGSSGN